MVRTANKVNSCDACGGAPDEYVCDGGLCG